MYIFENDWNLNSRRYKKICYSVCRYFNEYFTGVQTTIKECLTCNAQTKISDGILNLTVKFPDDVIESGTEIDPNFIKVRAILNGLWIWLEVSSRNGA